MDRHVVKIITEINQCLSTCYENGKAPYRHSHFNHPICKWIRQSLANYNLSINYCDSLCREYTYRYGKIHKGELVLKFFKDNKPIINDIGVTVIPRCFGDYKSSIIITNSIVNDYRQYYKLAKSHLFKWTKREIPYWLK